MEAVIVALIAGGFGAINVILTGRTHKVVSNGLHEKVTDIHEKVVDLKERFIGHIDDEQRHHDRRNDAFPHPGTPQENHHGPR